MFVHFYLPSEREGLSGETHEGVRGVGVGSEPVEPESFFVESTIIHCAVPSLSLSLSLSCQTLAESASRGISSWFTCGQD